jgi:NADPH:quinone reductase-like Zn-dependent oxidoreductase
MPLTIGIEVAAVIAALGPKTELAPGGGALGDEMVLLGSDDFPQAARDTAASDLSQAAAHSALSVTVARVPPLAQIAAAHELMETGTDARRVLLSLP